MTSPPLPEERELALMVAVGSMVMDSVALMLHLPPFRSMVEWGPRWICGLRKVRSEVSMSPSRLMAKLARFPSGSRISLFRRRIFPSGVFRMTSFILSVSKRSR